MNRQDTSRATTISGKVILAGAGPGDLDLITLKLCKALQHAEVIITDRLVNPAIIETFANKNALVIFADKQGFSDASITMKEINVLITRHALQGKLVLRLKGGDVSFFSNVLDELQNLVKHHIPFEIIPGITAAAGASAYAAIPLTARGYAQGVQFLTYYIEDQFMPYKWQQLATTTDTLVFYMSASHAIDIANRLTCHGAKEDTPMAVIEQATTPHQQVHVTSLSQCKIDFLNRTFSSPSLLIVGRVVQLHTSFNWFTNVEAGSVFRQLI
jgi:uroporphyrin-III C-methyltransferase